MEDNEDYGNTAKKLFYKNKKQADLKNVIQQVNDCWPEQMEVFKLRATLNYQFYIELKQVGFTPAESLEIVKARGM